MTLAETMAAFLVKVDLSAMSPTAREAAVGAIVDGIGVALAGSTTDPARIMYGMVLEEGGSPRATLLGRREKTGAPDAALANGTAMHALDPQAAKILIHARPKTGLEGKFSMEYCLAIALVDGAPGLRHFEEPWVSDARVQGLLPRITVRPDPALAGPDGKGMPAELTIHLRGGRAVRQRIDLPSGDPLRPLSAEDRRAKFLDCATPTLGAGGAGMALEALERLPTHPRLDDLLARVCGEGR